MILAAIVALASPPASEEDPFSMFEAFKSTQLFVLAILVPIAVAAFWYGSKRLKGQRSSSALRPRGRPQVRAGAGLSDPAWREAVARLEAGEPTAIASAKPGVVRVAGTLVNASGNLGGPSGRECVWRNRAGAAAEMAIAAELVIVADDSGRCGVENLEHARVIAPTERQGQHRENVSLYLGDRVEVVGAFEPEPIDGAASPEVVYGTLGADGLVQVRLIERPAAPKSPEPESS